MTITVLRDTSTGACYLTDFELDTDRVEACGYEIAGQLGNPEEVTLHPHRDTDEDEDDDTPNFTTCEEENCPLWLMISDEGGAPEHCSKHDPDVWTNWQTKNLSAWFATNFNTEAQEITQNSENSRDAAASLEHEAREMHEEHKARMLVTFEELDAVNWYEIAKNYWQGY